MAVNRLGALGVATGNNRISQLGPKVGGAIGAQQGATVTDTQQATVKIPAGGSITVNLPGISFYFPTLSSVLGVQARAINAGATRSFGQYYQGTGLRLGTSGFDKVELLNPDTVNVNTILIVVGGGVPNNTYDEFIDKRVIVTNNAASNVLVANGTTFAVGFKTRVPAWAELLNGNTTQIVAGGYNGKTRKQVMFSNNDIALVLQVWDSTGNPMGTIQPSTAFTFDTNDTVQLRNPNSGAVACNIGEIYYNL